MTDWNRFEIPIPISEYSLIPGVQVKVQHTYGLASDPKTTTYNVLIGEVNDNGGRCDCCDLNKEGACVVLAERVLVATGLLEAEE